MSYESPRIGLVDGALMGVMAASLAVAAVDTMGYLAPDQKALKENVTVTVYQESPGAPASTEAQQQIAAAIRKKDELRDRVETEKNVFEGSLGGVVLAATGLLYQNFRSLPKPSSPQQPKQPEQPKLSRQKRPKRDSRYYDVSGDMF